MREYRIGEAADLLGTSTDTVRRWADAGQLVTTRSSGGHRLIDGRELARFAQRRHEQETDRSGLSSRNAFTGIVTKVTADTVMAQVEVQAGPHRVVALISAEAVDELGLEPGVLATARVKATNVVVDRPA